jgi:transposase InsO family protein
VIGELKKAYDHYSVRALCELLEVSESTYYYSLKPQRISAKKQQMLAIVKQLHHEVDASYGKRRMQVELNEAGFETGLYQTASLMKQANVVAIRPRKRHVYPNNGTEDKIVKNHLNREFNGHELNTKFVGDITYIRTHQGWSYLACVMDLANREIVGWACSQSPNTELVIAALKKAIVKHQPNTNQLMFHSDQGSQYSSELFVNYLSLHGIKQSMSRRGNCWDNSPMERFFRSLKTERLHRITMINHDTARSVIKQYIRFYNYKRRHSANNYLSPAMKRKEMQKTA